MQAYTDYPITELGDAPGQLAEVRPVEVLSYDGNKYCYVEVGGIRKNIKRGYLYAEPVRCGDNTVPIDVESLPNARS